MPTQDIVTEKKISGRQLQRRFRVVRPLSDDRLCRRFYAINEIANKPCDLHIWLGEKSLNPMLWSRFEKAHRHINTLGIQQLQTFFGSGISEEHQRFSVHSVAEGEVLSEDRLYTLPTAKKLAYLAKFGSIIEKMHRNNVFHGRLAPSRIIARKESASPLLTIMHSRAGVMLPVPLNESKNTIVNLNDLSYFAPELWDGQPATIISDIYSISVIILEVLTGAKAIYGSTLEELLVRKNRMDLSLQLSDVRTKFPGGLSEALEMGTSPNPTERKTTASHITQILRGLSNNSDSLRISGSISNVGHTSLT